MNGWNDELTIYTKHSKSKAIETIIRMTVCITSPHVTTLRTQRNTGKLSKKATGNHTDESIISEFSANMRCHDVGCQTNILYMILGSLSESSILNNTQPMFTIKNVYSQPPTLLMLSSGISASFPALSQGRFFSAINNMP